MQVFFTVIVALIFQSFQAEAAFFARMDAPLGVQRQEWIPQGGDRVAFDTKENRGYLIHEHGEYMTFPIVTGQHRYVHYIGRFYHAKTPTWNWIAKKIDLKKDRMTYGPSGRFLRLFRNGDIRTSYGIHEHGEEASLFDENPAQRFRSMGCIIVQEDMMDIIVDTFEKNSSELPVITRYGFEGIEKIIQEANTVSL